MADIIFNKNPRVVSRYELAPRLNIDGLPEPPPVGLVIPPTNEDFFNYLNKDNPSVLERFCQERIHSEGTLVVYRA